eukprot:363-Amorphochlora_amoeboformis.AAC.1
MPSRASRGMDSSYGRRDNRSTDKTSHDQKRKGQGGRKTRRERERKENKEKEGEKRERERSSLCSKKSLLSMPPDDLSARCHL